MKVLIVRQELPSNIQGWELDTTFFTELFKKVRSEKGRQEHHFLSLSSLPNLSPPPPKKKKKLYFTQSHDCGEFFFLLI